MLKTLFWFQRFFPHLLFHYYPISVCLVSLSDYLVSFTIFMQIHLHKFKRQCNSPPFFGFWLRIFSAVSVLRGNLQQKSPVGTWSIIRLIEVSFLRLSVLQRFFYEKDTYVLPGHVKVSILERCPSYGMFVLRGLTV